MTTLLQAAPADEILLLEVSVNGRQTQAVVPFTRRAGKLYASVEELQAAGIRLTAQQLQQGQQGQQIDLASFSDDVQLDMAAQKININVRADMLGTTQLTMSSADDEARAMTDRSLGALINYDVLASQTAGSRALSGLAEARVFYGPHVFSSTGLAYAQGGRFSPLRLDTTYTHSSPTTMQRYSVGDFISNGLTWSRPVRIGGLQLSTDFSLRPDLVTFPTPDLRGEAVVASNVDLFLNGIRQLSEAVPPGPFEIRRAPVATGAGTVSIAVTDALGRQTFRNIPFYASEKLLRDGLFSYSLEAGALRRNYGLQSSDYGGMVASASTRYGYSPTLTLEGHAETANSLRLAGMGLATTLYDWGVLSAAISGSTMGDRRGRQYMLGFERRAAEASFSVSKLQADRDYRDIGAVYGSPVPRALLNASVGLYSQQYGSLNLAYTSAKTTLPGTENMPEVRQIDADIFSFSYFKSIFNRANFFLTGFRNSTDQSYGLTMGLLMALGGRDSVSATYTSGGGLRNLSLQASRPAIVAGDIGWQLQANEGDYTQRLAEFSYRADAARASFAVAQNANLLSQRANVRGAVVWADRSFFLSNWVDDSFAIVDTNGISDVPVFAENRKVGRTDQRGKLLIPDLRSYELNKISLDLTELPLDVQVGVSEQTVRPQHRNGVIAHFKLARSLGARIILRDQDGKFLPVGSQVRMKRGGVQALVGYDGETYFPEVQIDNNLEIITATGARCRMNAGSIPQKDTIPVIGPLTCK
ncbi:fimbrial biogenesis outer membrane usher protein [Undibacterium sp. CY18W]|uniref:Fimbrial biogenesis outer membrane usher protein n=1 Tax=Undibacterium hunanense TaxID=2762292 RepID=A0ABR6ZS05_9BURK|nr:fimbria/pilus outer membrane usher protein [Undibacterium hunanense]MBC3918404.1 fimbrial biogenesis outer membrane usher protein [Undibacterium hunanense]